METSPPDEGSQSNDFTSDGFLGGASWRVAAEVKPLMPKELPVSLTMPSQSIKPRRSFATRIGYYKQDTATMPFVESGLKTPGTVNRTTSPDLPNGV